MVALTDTASNLLITKLLAEGVLRGVLLLRICLPVGGWTENDVLSDRGGGEIRSGRMIFLVTKLGPFLAFSNARVDVLLDDRNADLAGCLDLLPGVVETVRDYRLGTIGIGDDLLGGRAVASSNSSSSAQLARGGLLWRGFALAGSPIGLEPRGGGRSLLTR